MAIELASHPGGPPVLRRVPSTRLLVSRIGVGVFSGANTHQEVVNNRPARSRSFRVQKRWSAGSRSHVDASSGWARSTLCSSLLGRVWRSSRPASCWRSPPQGLRHHTRSRPTRRRRRLLAGRRNCRPTTRHGAMLLFASKVAGSSVSPHRVRELPGLSFI